MKKYAILFLLFAFPCSARAQKTPKSLPMPAVVSHGQPISNYGCFFTEASRFDYLDVTVFAEYGKKHKRYWSKTLGIYRSGIAGQQLIESTAALDKANEHVVFGEAGDKCRAWKGAVFHLLQNSKGK